MKKIISIIVGMAVLQAGAQNVGIGTNQPKARLHVADSSVLFTGPDVLPSNPAPPPMQGPGKRLMWYADKAAFRLGSVFDNSWDKDSIGIGSIVFGNGGKADGNFAMAIGSGSIVKSTLGISIGLSNFIDTGANFSMSMGNGNRIKGSQSFAFGNTNFMDTAADFSTSMGNSNLIEGRQSFAIGNFNRTGADFAQAYGSSNILFGRSSVALGNGLTMPAFRGVSIGSFNSFFQQEGGTIWFDQDPLLVVGNGRDDANRSTAITVLKNGNTGIGKSIPTAKLDVLQNAEFTPAIYALSSPTNPESVGNAITATITSNFGSAIYAYAPTSGNVAIVDGNGGYGYIAQVGDGKNGMGTFSTNGVSLRAVTQSGTALSVNGGSGFALNSLGNIRFSGLGEADGKVLVSSFLGNATWQNPPKITLNQPSATGQSAVEFRNQGGYVGSFGWSQASTRYFLYDGNTNTNPLVIKDGRVGLGDRNPITNMLEVNGNASKSSAGSWLGNSDARLKKNMVPIPSALEQLLQLKGITYEWNDNRTGYTRPAGKQFGFTAQNVQDVFPTMVSSDAQGYLQTAYGTYDPLIVEAIRELKNENEWLKKEIEAIKALLLKK